VKFPQTSFASCWKPSVDGAEAASLPVHVLFDNAVDAKESDGIVNVQAAYQRTQSGIIAVVR
jgi:hypothetical protein